MFHCKPAILDTSIYGNHHIKNDSFRRILPLLPRRSSSGSQDGLTTKVRRLQLLSQGLDQWPGARVRLEHGLHYPRKIHKKNHRTTMCFWWCLFGNNLCFNMVHFVSMCFNMFQSSNRHKQFGFGAKPLGRGKPFFIQTVGIWTSTASPCKQEIDHSWFRYSSN